MIEKMELARQLAAVGEGEMEVLRLLCAGAERELRARLRPGLSRRGCCGKLAGGGMARPGGAGGDPGGTSVLLRRRPDDSEQWPGPERMVSGTAWETLRPWMRDEGFSFRGVRG